MLIDATMQATEAAIPARTGQHEEALRLFAEGNYREGARLLADALKTRETSELWNDWATAQLMLGDTVDAEEGYRRALELDPQNACAAGNLGIQLASGGRIPEAVPLLERAASGSTGAERQHLLRLARAYRAQPLVPPGTNPNHNSNSDKQLMLQMARVIHQQSQAIARLTERVCGVEAAIARLANRPLPSPC